MRCNISQQLWWFEFNRPWPWLWILKWIDLIFWAKTPGVQTGEYAGGKRGAFQRFLSQTFEPSLIQDTGSPPREQRVLIVQGPTSPPALSTLTIAALITPRNRAIGKPGENGGEKEKKTAQSVTDMPQYYRLAHYCSEWEHLPIILRLEWVSLRVTCEERRGVSGNLVDALFSGSYTFDERVYR